MNFFRRFMIGRYGSDQLNMALLVVGLLLILLRWVTRWQFLAFLTLAVLVVCYIRMFSRNINARYRENQLFLQWWNPMGRWFSDLRARFAARKTHRFFKCPTCRKRLRVPRGRGKIQITCPHCHMQFTRKS